MNNFNTVFLAVKKQLGAPTHNSPVVSIEELATATALQPGRLDFYITCLEEVGVVEYCRRDNTVSLTAVGKKRAEVFV